MAFCLYGKCSQTLYTKVSDKMANANSTDPDQIDHSESTLFAMPLSILRNCCIICHYLIVLLKTAGSSSTSVKTGTKSCKINRKKLSTMFLTISHREPVFLG